MDSNTADLINLSGILPSHKFYLILNQEMRPHTSGAAEPETLHPYMDSLASPCL